MEKTKPSMLSLFQRERIGDSQEGTRKSHKQFPSPFGGKIKGEGQTSLSPEQRIFARGLRKETTDAEQLLWGLLRNSQLGGFKFRRQHPVGKYVLDFYCHEARLGVELDGGQHSETAQRKRDGIRSAFLAREGIAVVRFWNNEVLNETEGVLEALLFALTPALSQRERGEDRGLSEERGAGYDGDWEG